MSRVALLALLLAAAPAAALGAGGDASVRVLADSYEDEASGTPLTRVAPGATVTWRWVAGVHSVTQGAGVGSLVVLGGFDSGVRLEGDEYAVRFDAEGAFPYYCQVHDWMRGLVLVDEG